MYGRWYWPILSISRCLLWRKGGPKYGYFGGEYRAVMAGLLWGEDPTWKPFYAPYHISLHGWTCIWAIFDLSMHIYGAGGVQNMAIWGVKAGYHGRLVTVWVNSSGKCLVCHITSLYMTKHQLGPFMSSRGTFMAQGGSKIRLFWGEKQGCYGGRVKGRGPSLKNVLCAILCLITWLNMYLGHFWPVHAHLWRRGGPKYGHLGDRLVTEWGYFI